MSNRERAAEIIRQFLNGKEPHSTMLRNRLDNAGLLAPDLPEKTKRGDWKPTDTTTVTIEEDGTITVKEKISPIQTLIDWNATPEDTEKLAHALLAAVKDTRND